MTHTDKQQTAWRLLSTSVSDPDTSSPDPDPAFDIF